MNKGYWKVVGDLFCALLIILLSGCAPAPVGTPGANALPTQTAPVASPAPTNIPPATTPPPTAAGEPSLQFKALENSHLTQMAWSPDGQKLAAVGCYTGCQLQLLNPADLSRLWVAELNGTLAGLYFNPSGDNIAVLVDTGKTEILLFNTRDGALLWQAALAGSASKLEFSPNGKNIAVLVQAGQTGIWLFNTPDGANLRQWEVGSTLTLRYSPAGDQIATTGSRLNLWDASSGALLWKLEPAELISRVRGPKQARLSQGPWRGGGNCEVERFDLVTFSQARPLLFVSGAGSGCVLLLALDPATRQMVSQADFDVPEYLDRNILALNFNEQDSELALMLTTGLHRWKLDTNEVRTNTLLGEMEFGFDLSSPSGAAFNPQGDLMAFWAEINAGASWVSFYLFDLATEENIDLLSGEDHDDAYSTMLSIAFSLDGRWLAALSESGSLRVWNMDDYRH